MLWVVFWTQRYPFRDRWRSTPPQLTGLDAGVIFQRFAFKLSDANSENQSAILTSTSAIRCSRGAALSLLHHSLHQQRSCHSSWRTSRCWSLGPAGLAVNSSRTWPWWASGTLMWSTWTQLTCQTSTGNSCSDSLMWANSRLRYISENCSKLFQCPFCQLFVRLQPSVLIDAYQDARYVSFICIKLDHILEISIKSGFFICNIRWNHTTARFKTTIATFTVDFIWLSVGWTV